MSASVRGLQASTHAYSTQVNTREPKAFYRITKLDRNEIQRRGSTGRCTYCNESGHSRRSCAAGRIMRKVPKRVLDVRLRNSVCPLCGDPKGDNHSKITCPRKRELQAALAHRERSGCEAEGEAAKNPTRQDARKKTPNSPKKPAKNGHRMASALTADADLIDFGVTFDTLPTAADTVPSGKATQLSLLDMAVTEVVWGNITILPLVKAETHGKLGSLDTEEDLIDLGLE